MKRFYMLIVLLCAFAAMLWAGDGDAENMTAGGPLPRFSLGSGVVLESFKSGGYGELLFTLTEGDGYQTRLGFVLAGFGSQDGWGLGQLALKFSLGGPWNGAFRSYGFLEAGAGVAGGGGNDFSLAPLPFDIRGGGGAEILLYKNSSLFFEYGGGFLFFAGALPAGVSTLLDGGYAHFSMGLRYYR